MEYYGDGDQCRHLRRGRYGSIARVLRGCSRTKTTYGGVGETFTSLQLGANFINLFTHDQPVAFWGRVIIHVSDPDSVHTDITAAVAAGRLAPGCQPHALPADAPWGERYFHVNDPDGHELSFARLL